MEYQDHGKCSVCGLPTLYPNGSGARAVHAQCLESGPGAGGFAVLDFETGGLDARVHAIVSAAVIVLDASLVQAETWYSVVNEPEKRIEDGALLVNGLSRDEIAAGMPVDEALEQIGALMERRVPVCHNAAFDLAFLNARGFSVRYAVDTMHLAWRVWPARKAKLGFVAARMGIFPDGSLHNSLTDALTTAEVLRRFNAMKLKPAATVPQVVDFDWRRR